MQLPDEAIHLAAALQFAGDRHVIATAWSIGDKQAPDVARDTYTALMAGRALDTSRAAAAIHGAAGALRARYIHAGLISGLPTCISAPERDRPAPRRGGSGRGTGRSMNPFGMSGLLFGTRRLGAQGGGGAGTGGP